MDLEYTEFVGETAVIVSLRQQETGLWIASARFRDADYEAHSDAAKHARAAVMAILNSETSDANNPDRL